MNRQPRARQVSFTASWPLAVYVKLLIMCLSRKLFYLFAWLATQVMHRLSLATRQVGATLWLGEQGFSLCVAPLAAEQGICSWQAWELQPGVF